MPSTTSSEIDVDFAIEPHPYNCAVPDQPDDISSASERWHHASQYACSFRHVRLTVSFDTAPLNSAPSARRTRLVLVPDRQAPAINAFTCLSSACSVAVLRCAIPGGD